MNQTKYPRILIVGQYFELRTGGGITMSNLFRDWPEDRIAVVAANILNPDFLVCKKNYLLGPNEILLNFPFSLKFWGKHKIGGGILTQDIPIIANNTNNPSRSRLKDLYIKLLDFLGLIHTKRKFVITNELQMWIKDFSPDIIYSQISSRELIRFVNDLHKTFNLPIAIHIMDDWPSTIGRTGPFRSYWGRKIELEFRQLISQAKILMSISEYMSDVYLTRYGKKFTPFHNPVVIEKWLPYYKVNWAFEGIFKILYTGRIGTANGKSIILMAKVINAVNQKEIRIQLDIYTPDSQSRNAESIRNLRGVKIAANEPYETIPHLLSKYDLLYLPLDFDNEGLMFARLSIPTKVSEYMISGTPILVYADKSTALAKYALEYGWAYTVSESREETLTQAIVELESNQQLRKELAEKARRIAIQNENADLVREKFRSSFILD